MIVALLPFEWGQRKSPETLRGLEYYYYNHSNDITNPDQRLYATTNIDFVASFYCKYVNTISNKQKNFLAYLNKNIFCKTETDCYAFCHC
jgi:hypothetical protein